MEGIRCEKLLWLRVNKPEFAEPFDDPTLHLFEVGRRVEQLARIPFPGILIEREGIPFKSLIEKTVMLMANHTVLIYEGTFNAKNCICRADILEPVSEDKTSPWNLHEIKMSTKLKPEHITDCGVQTYCIEQSGYTIQRINLIHINAEYTRQGEINPLHLFKVEDITDRVRVESITIGKKIREFSKLCSEPEPPDVVIGSKCKQPGICQFYKYCHDIIPMSSVFELPYGQNVIPKLIKSGITLLINIPQDFPLTIRQKKLVKSAKIKKPIVDKADLRSFLDKFIFPLCFFDFETVSPAIPLLEKSRPYERIPFQYSLHILLKDGQLKHKEYLHDIRTDPRETILKSLIKDLRTNGSIVTWNMSFEASVLKSLASIYPKYSKQINSLLLRIVDLIIPFRSGIYSDYRCKGSASIKSVLPVLCPELSYESLSVQKGDQASLLFEKYLEGSMAEEEWCDVKPGLLSYCELDTLAMVEIYRKLVKTCKGKV